MTLDNLINQKIHQCASSNLHVFSFFKRIVPITLLCIQDKIDCLLIAQVSLESPVRSRSRPIWMPMDAASRSGTRRDACARRAYFNAASPLSACALVSRQMHGFKLCTPTKRPGILGYTIEYMGRVTGPCLHANTRPHLVRKLCITSSNFVLHGARE